MRRYLLFVSQLYAYAILRPLAAAAAARGDDVAWFFEHAADARFLRAGERRLASVAEVRTWRPDAVFVPGNWVPHFFPDSRWRFSTASASASAASRADTSASVAASTSIARMAPTRQRLSRRWHASTATSGWSRPAGRSSIRYLRDSTGRPHARADRTLRLDLHRIDHGRAPAARDDRAARRKRRMGVAADAAPEDGAGHRRGLPRA